jgi:hypothetical protein
MPDHSSAELFTMFAMNRLGFDYHPLNENMPSKSVH